MADVLCLDVWRRVVPRLDLQAAREMQEVVAGVVEEAVASLVAHVLATPPPDPVADLLREFATPPGPARGFRQLVADDCLLLTTPHDASHRLPKAHHVLRVVHQQQHRAVRQVAVQAFPRVLGRLPRLQARRHQQGDAAGQQGRQQGAHPALAARVGVGGRAQLQGLARRGAAAQQPRAVQGRGRQHRRGAHVQRAHVGVVGAAGGRRQGGRGR